MENKTVYHDMGYLMAESLGLVSEEGIKQMDDVGDWNAPGDLAKQAKAARAAGKKPAKPKKMSDAATIRAMKRDTRMLRGRAGATGNESGPA